MKYFLPIISCLLYLNLYGQGSEKGMLYSADFWLDFKGNNGDFVETMNNPMNEKVEVLQTNSYFEVTFGSNVLRYSIESHSKYSKVRTDYTVSLKEEEFILQLMDNRKSSINMQYPFTFSLTDTNDKTIWSISQVNHFEEVDVGSD